MSMLPLQSWIVARGERVHVSALVDPVSTAAADTSAAGSVDRTICALEALPAAQELVTLAAGTFLDGSSWLAALESDGNDGDGDAEPGAASAVSAEARELRGELERLQLSPTLRLVLALLHERARESASLFAGYVAQLPACIPLPLTWSARARRRLKRTAAAPSVDAELVARLFESFAAPLARKFPGMWGGAELTLARFQWAYAVVSSRAFTIDGAKEPALLPVIDMANHDHANPAAKIVRTDDGAFRLVTLRSVAKGEAVTISYGDLSNAELLCRYGFVLPASVPSDCILVSDDELLATYTAFLNDDVDNLSDRAQSADEGSDGDTAQQAAAEPAAKKRRVFAEKQKQKSAEGDDALFFRLHGNQAQEFGLGDALLSFVFARNLPADALYDVLAVLLRRRDKAYSAVIEQEKEAAGEEAALVLQLTKHERAVCRRILLGLLTLAENSSDDDDDDDGDDDGEQEEEDDE